MPQNSVMSACIALTAHVSPALLSGSDVNDSVNRKGV